MTKALITTVIPTFRRPFLLKRAIESVLAQSFTDLKVCIYDNDSGDETETIVQTIAKRDNRVFYYRNNKNIGACANIFQGLSAVTTPFYSLLSDDDFLLPGFYERAITVFRTNRDIGFVCSKTSVIDLINKKIQYRNQDWKPGVYQPSNDIVAKMYLSHFVTTGVLLSRELRDSIGVFDHSGSDLLYMTIASAYAPFAVLDSYGAALTLHETAYSMVEEGVTKESIHILYENLLSSAQGILDLTIPSERKVQLLMYIIKFYHQHFDTKKLNYLMKENREDGIESLLLLPLLISNRGLVAKSYEVLPKNLNFLVTTLFKWVRFLKRSLNRNTGLDWIDLENEAYLLLKEHSDDISKITPFLSPNK